MQYLKKKKPNRTVNSLHNVWDVFLGVKLCCASGNRLCLLLSDTAPLTNPICHSVMKCFISINVVVFYVVHTQPMISTAPQMLLLVLLLEIKVQLKPLQEDPSELCGCSAQLLVTAGSSAWTGKSFPGNLLGICLGGESRVICMLLSQPSLTKQGYLECV